MLSAQHREFEEKKKDASPYPRDFTRWYTLDYFRRPSSLKARRFIFTFGAALAAAFLSMATLTPGYHRTHQAAPLATAHAMFNHDCAVCHDRALQPVARLFGSAHAASISDAACNKCHLGTIHHAKQAHDPSCVSCHREHRGHEVLATHVADRQCTACHRDLTRHVKDGEAVSFHGSIIHFNSDHPEFQPSLKSKRDPSHIQFNHKAHLDLDLEALRKANERAGRPGLTGMGAAMTCADCHQMDDARKYLKPIAYENHCARCHTLSVALAGNFEMDLKAAADAFGKTPLPHKEPALVRAVLRDRLIQFAARNGVVGAKLAVEAPRPLPWKPAVSDEQWTWASDQTKKAEGLLFMNQQWQKSDTLTMCSHCHVEKGHADGLPIYEKTLIPQRWYKQSVFNHGSHRNLGCVDCHDKNAAGIKVADSKSAADILLPTLQTCQQCHTGSGGARNTCVECHRYHAR